MVTLKRETGEGENKSSIEDNWRITLFKVNQQLSADYVQCLK